MRDLVTDSLPMEAESPITRPRILVVDDNADNLFTYQTALNSLEYDIERLQRINKTLELIPPNVREKAGSNLRPVGSLIISPTQSVDQIAAKYLHVLPSTIRVFLHGIGATRTSGSSILSYLRFDRRFCSELIALGYHDAMDKADEIAQFMDED